MSTIHNEMHRCNRLCITRQNQLLTTIKLPTQTEPLLVSSHVHKQFHPLRTLGMLGGYLPTYFTLNTKILKLCELLFSNSILLGFIDLASMKINFCKQWAFIIISFEIEVDSSLLRRQSLIYFMSLNERSTVAVDMGKTIAMESKVLILGNHF